MLYTCKLTYDVLYRLLCIHTQQWLCVRECGEIINIIIEINNILINNIPLYCRRLNKCVAVLDCVVLRWAVLCYAGLGCATMGCVVLGWATLC